MRLASLTLLLPFVVSFSLAAGRDWPEFRGPNANVHVTAENGKEIGLPLHWSETNNVKWKTEIPYYGISTPVVVDNQVWLTTAKQDGHDFYALRLDANTGRITLNEPLFHSDDPESLGNGASMNSYATPTSIAEAGRIYIHFGSFGTACLDATSGKVLWKRRIGHLNAPIEVVWSIVTEPKHIAGWFSDWAVSRVTKRLPSRPS